MTRSKPCTMESVFHAVQNTDGARDCLHMDGKLMHSKQAAVSMLHTAESCMTRAILGENARMPGAQNECC